MENITQPLKEIIDKGFPGPREDRIVEPGGYKFVNQAGSTVHSNFDGTPEKPSSINEHVGVGFYFDGPFLPIRNGACYTLYNLMRSLGRTKVVTPTLMNCFREWDQPEDYFGQDFGSAFIAPEDYYHDTGLVRKARGDYGIQVAQFYNTEILTSLGPWLIRDNVKLMLDVQNVDYVLMERLGASKEDVEKAKRLQIDAINMSDHTFCRSEIDRQHIINLGANPNSVTVYRGGINVSDFEFKERTQGGKKIVYMGHMYYQPNENALNHIVTTVMPKLDNEYTLTVVGSCPPYIEEEYAGSRVIFKGGVDDLNKELQEYDIAIAPIFEGSGTRLKLLDYLASGVPVVTTDLGIEGLDENIRRCLTIENDISNYATAVKTINTDPAPFQHKSRLGRKFIESMYDWSHCVQPFVDVYQRSIRS